MDATRLHYLKALGRLPRKRSIVFVNLKKQASKRACRKSLAINNL